MTGEPMHDIINLRRAASPAKNDYWGLVFYHIGMLNRVSAEPAEAAFRHAVGAPELPGGTQHLLREIVEQHREAACRAVLENPGAADAVRGFLRRPGHNGETLQWTIPRDICHTMPSSSPQALLPCTSR